MDIGTRIGGFELSEKLSETYDSQLWTAVNVDDASGDRVVIRLPGSDEDGARAREEYEILSQLNDPRIPRPLGFDDARGAVILEHIEGVTVEEVLEAARQHLFTLNLGTAVDIGLEVAHALRAAHQVIRARGRIVHGHLSPDRVMVTEGGEIKLLGLGAPPAPRPYPYQPPEIALRLPFDARTDQWLTAALICEMASSSLPERSLHRGPHRDLHLPPTLAEGLARIGRVSPHLSEILTTALSAKPADRYSPETVFLRELYTVSRSLRQPTHRHEMARLVAAYRPRLQPAADAPRIPTIAERSPVDEPTLDYEDETPTNGKWTRTEPAEAEPGPAIQLPHDLPPIGDELEYTDPAIDPEESDEDAFSFATWLREKQRDDVDTFETTEDGNTVPYFEYTPLTNYVRPDKQMLASLEQTRPEVDDRFLSWSRWAAFTSLLMMILALGALVALKAGIF